MMKRTMCLWMLLILKAGTLIAKESAKPKFQKECDKLWRVVTCNGDVCSKDGQVKIDLPASSEAKVEVVFTIPKNARLDDISFEYQIEKGSLEGVDLKLTKIVKGGDLPDPRILNVGKKHSFNIPLGPPQPSLITTPTQPVFSTVAILDPVFDILQPCEKIKYKFLLEFTSKKCAQILLSIKNIQPIYTFFTLPTPPAGISQPTILPKSTSPLMAKSGSLADGKTRTPIKHVILLLQENVAFDSMFGTYPIAQNLPGENPFFPLPGTQIPDNLLTIDPLTGGNYLTTNRNVGQNGQGKVNPQRFAPNQELTSFESNGYTRLQIDVHNGLMDRYVLNQTTPKPITFATDPTRTFDATYGQGANIAMNYWDGNSFTGLWNYAQHYAMNDQCFTTGYGESEVAALNWGSGNTGAIVPEFPHLKIDVRLLELIVNAFSANPQMPPVPPGVQFVEWGDVLATFNNVALYNWVFPRNDVSILLFLLFWFVDVPASIQNVFFPNGVGLVDFVQKFTANFVNPKYKNIGDLLNKKNITWGAFRGGWLPKQSLHDPNAIVDQYQDIFPPNVIADLKAIMPEFNTLVLLTHFSLNPLPPQGSGGAVVAQIVGVEPDFEAVQPFDFYASTDNQHILPPSSLENVGQTDAANHNYDIDDFFNALEIGVLPAVSYVRLPKYQDGHPSTSTAFDNQIGVVNLVTKLMNSPFWNETAIFLQWDESNGNYDHKPPLLVKSSDWKVNPNIDPKDQIARRGAKAGIPLAQLRAGYAPRIPFLIISPWAKQNYISHHLTDQTSVMKFIEKNWGLGEVGNDSYDAIAHNVCDMFDFNPQRVLAPKVFINPATGEVVAIEPS